ncbi:MAG TPA: site-2 protease family protein [Bryobacteraceae bacterium]|nr:site-2 protease family protein [Bryobacteraceae bacterium]
MAEERSTPRAVSPGSVGSIKLMGVPIRLHFTFVLLLIFLVVIGLGSNQSPAYYSLFILAMIASVLLHEFGHSFISSLYGIRTLEIVMYPIGGVARMERPAKPREEFWIALTGPLVNLLIAGAVFALLYSQNKSLNLFALDQPSDANLADRIALGNLILAGFNLLPAFPMDGGRMFRALISRIRSEYEATRIATWSGRMLAISMGLYGFIYMPMLAFVAFFIYLGAANEGAASRGRSLTQGIPVRAAMVTEYHTLSHGSTVRDAANLLLSTAQQDFPVVHGDQVIGLLGRNALLRGMAAEGPESYIASFMDREFAIVAPDKDLSEVLPVMAHAGACALVMDEGQLLGMLTAENLSQFLLLRSVGLNP